MPRSTDIYQYLSTTGVPALNNTSAIGNYSEIAQNFFFECPNDAQYADINRMIVYYEDTGNFIATGFGASNALTNGIVVKSEKEDEQVIFTCARPIKKNSAWNSVCYDGQPITYGSGPNGFSVRWTFGNSGKPTRLYPGEKFMVTLNDDMTFLEEFTFIVQGQYKWK